MKRLEFLGFLLLCAPACGPGETTAEPPAIHVAALANDDCSAPSTEGLPPEVDAIDVEVATGRVWNRVARVERALDAPALLVEGVPTGEQTRLRFVACSGTTATHVATVNPLNIEEGDKHFLTLHFKSTNALSCTGTAFGPAYNQYAALGRPRAFAAAAKLSDGRVLVAGGAATADGDTLRGSAAGAAWDLYSPYESLFLPGVDRAQPYAERPMRAARIGAVAVPYERGALVFGGAPEVEWGAHALQRGPLTPVDGALSSPAAERFDPTTGGWGVVLGATSRFMPGAAADGAGRAVIAGGLVFQDGVPEATGLVEVLVGGVLSTTALPTGLLGPSVTAIGDGRFLVWGADVAECGARPGWLVTVGSDLAPEPTVQQLTVIATPGPPNCVAPAVGCRDWYPTAFHTATRLADADGKARVLISGGITLDAGGLVHNPDQGATCRPNAFVLSIDAVSLRAELHPVDVADDALKTAKRALHQAAPAGGRVLLTGGWANLGTPTALSAADGALFYDDEIPAGRLSPARFTLSQPRLGHLATAVDGTVVIAGGVSREGATTSLSHTATVYVPPAGLGSCAPPEEEE